MKKGMKKGTGYFFLLFPAAAHSLSENFIILVFVENFLPAASTVKYMINKGIN